MLFSRHSPLIIIPIIPYFFSIWSPLCTVAMHSSSSFEVLKSCRNFPQRSSALGLGAKKRSMAGRKLHSVSKKYKTVQQGDEKWQEASYPPNSTTAHR